MNVYAETCESLLGDGLYKTIRDDVLKPLRIVAPILLLIFTSLDFAKGVFSDKKDGQTKAWQNFLKRGAATLLVFFAPNIIDFILGLIDLALCSGL